MTGGRGPGVTSPRRAPDPRTPGRGLVPAALAVAAGAYAWVVTGLRPFTWPTRAVVAATVVVVLGAGAAARRFLPALTGHGDGQRGQNAVGRAGWPWLVLVPALAGVQLFAYFAGFGGARSDYPTLSWIYGHVEWRVGRAAGFGGWLALGVYLMRR
ncbi:MAG TPA: hypothetical protein VE575_12820 [Acidimicrobiales bacterium]|nr:hypothetical protein [Acidimicrobiales bacterium]